VYLKQSGTEAWSNKSSLFSSAAEKELSARVHGHIKSSQERYGGDDGLEVLCRRAGAALRLIDTVYCRGLTELVQHSAYRGSLRWRKAAASYLVDMVWLNHSPISMGRSGIFYLFV
jgi:hypothetical protein